MGEGKRGRAFAPNIPRKTRLKSRLKGLIFVLFEDMGA
ncbi:hypothetical protein HHE01_12620 [Helicobacter heilmannii]|uniref:Uncharacterized protein n=1 Tax=Helicobacter heilmannii TaxID=35817 RepID=A0A0K2Y5H9_HELHE|nr:hypothetical protein HHE01_12620 [Helicobacter heilmannii]